MSDFYTDLRKNVKEALKDPDPSISYMQLLLEEQDKLIVKLRNILNIERAIYKDTIETVEEAVDILKEIKAVRR